MTPLDATNGKRGRIPARLLDPRPLRESGLPTPPRYEAAARAAGNCPYCDNRPCPYAATWECDQTCDAWPFGEE